MPPALSLTVLTAAFAAVALLERTHLRFTPLPFRRPHLLTDAAWYLVATLSAIVFAVVLGPLLARLAIPVLADAMSGLPTVVLVIVAVVAYDAIAFAVHVLLHESQTLWIVHKVHHSSRQLDWLATTRTHLFELFVRSFPAQAALFAVGIPVRVIAAALTVYGLFALLGHSNLRLPLRWA